MASLFEVGSCDIDSRGGVVLGFDEHGVAAEAGSPLTLPTDEELNAKGVALRVTGNNRAALGPFQQAYDLTQSRGPDPGPRALQHGTPTGSPGDTTLVVRANNGLTVFSAPFILREEAPQHWWVLSHTFHQTAAIRTSRSSIEIVHENVPLFPLGPTGIVRTTPFRAGDIVAIPGLHATVMRVEFGRDLDSSEVAWIVEGRSGFAEVDPRPPVGIGVRLAS